MFSAANCMLVELGVVEESSMRLAKKVEIVTGAGSGIGRVGKPEDIASAALYWASDKASIATGSVIVVDGGITAGNL